MQPRDKTKQRALLLAAWEEGTYPILSLAVVGCPSLKTARPMQGKSPHTGLEQSAIPAPTQPGLSSMQWEPDWSSQGLWKGWKHFMINDKVLRKVSSRRGKLPGFGQPHPPPPTFTWEFSLGSRMLHLKPEGLIPTTIHRGFRAALGGISVTSRRLFLVI